MIQELTDPPSIVLRYRDSDMLAESEEKTIALRGRKDGYMRCPGPSSNVLHEDVVLEVSSHAGKLEFDTPDDLDQLRRTSFLTQSVDANRATHNIMSTQIHRHHYINSFYSLDRK